MEPDLEFNIDDFVINEIVIDDENNVTDNIPSIDDIYSNVNVASYCENTFSEGYESDDSDITVAMIDSCVDFNILKNDDSATDIVIITEQLKDVTNLIESRQRKSAIIKIEVPAESIEISKVKVPIIVLQQTEDTEQNITIPDEYYEGKLLWCKLKSYPWWPAMIYHSPEKTYYKENFVHVVYFGPNAERGWIHVKDIFLYEGKAAFDQKVNKLKADKTPKYILKNYCVSTSITTWNKAWQEAETALSLNLTKRLRNHGMSYRDLTGESSESSESESEGSTRESDVTIIENNVTITDNDVTITEDTTNDDQNRPTDTTDDSILMDTSNTGVIEAVDTLTSNDGHNFSVNSRDHESILDAIIRRAISNDQCYTAVSDGISTSSHSSLKTSTTVLEVRQKSKDALKGEDKVANTVRRKSIKPKSKVSPQERKIQASDDSSTVLCTPIGDSKQIILEYCNLKLPTFGSSKKVPICLLCLTNLEGANNEIVSCAGLCGHTFHAHCMVLLLDYVAGNESDKSVLNYRKCVDCNKNQRRCFMCRKLADKSKPHDIIKCNNNNCGRYYHPDCLNNGIYHNLVTHNRHGAITCPSHTCHSCHLENPASVRHTSSHVRCIMCPASFHRGEWCIPAGSREINSSYIICPQHLTKGGTFDMWLAPFMDCVKDGRVSLDKLHFKIMGFNDADNRDLWILEKSPKERKERPFNVTWCFICTKGGDLVCCEKCPAAFHQQCAQITELPERYVCEECHLGKYPRYGEVFWLKIGNYRWWPAQIIHPKNAPQRVLDSPHGEGQFLVLFFATNDYHWCNKTHAFTFDEGDDESSNATDSSNDGPVEATKDSRKVTIDKAYRRSLSIAGKAYRRRSKRWNEITGNGNKPNHYRTIRNNMPVGNVRINKQSNINQFNDDQPNINQCECRPGSAKNDRDPCGPTSDCINLTLMYECDPMYCRNGSKCRNQRFMQRQYPRQEVFSTPDRGWALRIKEDIKKGTFINEYVGEVIDETEANRRLKTSHENNVTNFYMMELDGGRIIDAGPAGNISRFMNHSCSPNVYTPKWLVNGDTRVGVFALHDIKEDEELTFNYNFLSLGKMKIPCKCGASNCSGYLGMPPKGPSSCDLQTMDQETQPKRSRKRAIPAKTNTERRAAKSKRDNSFEEPPAKKPHKDVAVVKEMKDLSCYLCKEKNCNLSCSFEDCPREYHSDCLELSETQKSLWVCPWHFCDDCGRLSETLCSFCTASFCDLHLGDRIVPSEDGGHMVCLSHQDPTKATESQTHSPSNTATDSPPSISI